MSLELPIPASAITTIPHRFLPSFSVGVPETTSCSHRCLQLVSSMSLVSDQKDLRKIAFLARDRALVKEFPENDDQSDGPYNTIRWNPNGKFICMAGYGNLPCDMAFWDYVEKKQLGTTKAEWAVVSEWSPDGLYFLTATTAPRRQIDNGIKIFHYNGSVCFKKKFENLYQVDWKVESPDKFGDIEQLIKSVSSLKVDSKSQGTYEP